MFLYSLSSFTLGLVSLWHHVNLQGTQVNHVHANTEGTYIVLAYSGYYTSYRIDVLMLHYRKL